MLKKNRRYTVPAKENNKKKGRANLITGILSVLNGFTLFALLMAYLSPWVSPGFSWPVALAGLFTNYLILLHLLWLPVWMVADWKWMIINLIAIGFGFSHIQASYQLFNTPEEGKNSVKVLTLNAHDFYSVNGKYEEIFKYVNSIGPDVVCVQEFANYYKGQNKTPLDFLKEKKLFSDIRFFPSDGFKNRGMLILSNLKVTQQGKLSFSLKNKGTNGCVFIDVQKGNEEFRIYNLHLASMNLSEEEVSLIRKGDYEKESQQQKILNALSKLRFGWNRQEEMISVISEHLENCQIPYILAGDFNNTPFSYIVNHLRKKHLDAFEEKGSGFGNTYTRTFPPVRIDYIFLPEEFKILNYKVERVRISDHFPIWVEFNIP